MRAFVLVLLLAPAIACAQTTPDAVVAGYAAALRDQAPYSVVASYFTSGARREADHLVAETARRSGRTADAVAVQLLELEAGYLDCRSQRETARAVADGGIRIVYELADVCGQGRDPITQTFRLVQEHGEWKIDQTSLQVE